MLLMCFLERSAKHYPLLRPGTVAHALHDQANSTFVHYELWKAPRSPRKKSSTPLPEENQPVS
jgi:hypothetical protein